MSVSYGSGDSAASVEDVDCVLYAIGRTPCTSAWRCMCCCCWRLLPLLPRLAAVVALAPAAVSRTRVACQHCAR
jgi:hypothetical protein